MPVGFLISIDDREATSHGATSIEAKLSFSFVGAPRDCTGTAALVASWAVCDLAFILDMVETGNVDADLAAWFSED